ncbi:MAG: DegT/DnrJ/EryC1/StrS family aminotransferase [Candidatus Omnitrophica bacterium]|nr:DegT/DnrJ/EryC1/StrS family aminotransferase [Candidatus Omnitrophota bacterium]
MEKLKYLKVNFLDVQQHLNKIFFSIKKVLLEVFKRNDFILGEDVFEFERCFSRYCGYSFAVGLNSGTDALFLSLKALDIGEGDEVIVPVFTFIATANAVSYTGARPVFVDIDEKTYTIDSEKIEKAITKKTKAIIPVHLFGQCANMSVIMKIAKKYRLHVIEDACQAHGAQYYFRNGRKIKTVKAGAIGDVGCFSFYPTKNLGGFGDGGMAVTNKRTLYRRLLQLRDCGRISRYKHAIIGYNSRLDTLQAAGLLVKLNYLDEWNRRRKQIASWYFDLLKDSKVILPCCADYSSHVYHIFAVRVPKRDKVAEFLSSCQIGTAIHYPIPLHLQPAYKFLGYKKGDFPVAEKISQSILSLPMHPFLTKKQVIFVAQKLKEAIDKV